VAALGSLWLFSNPLHLAEVLLKNERHEGGLVERFYCPCDGSKTLAFRRTL